MTYYAHLAERGVVELTGADRVGFLQGLVSNDVGLVQAGAAETGAVARAVWAALLTPQGKWVTDFFILADRDRLLLDCERSQAEPLVARLSRYRLRSKVAIRDLSAELRVGVAWGGEPAIADGAIAAPDPRLPEAGWRILSALPLPGASDPAAWDRHRIALGLPDGSRDLEPEKSVLLEAGFDELNGVSWTKGCYLGQELTARTRYRGLVKRRLVPVEIAGELPPPGSQVLRDGSDVGTMRSGADGLGMALLRLEALEGAPLECGTARLTPRVPTWLRSHEAAPSRLAAAKAVNPG
jgi:folate-binding protein YgfZ